jgi:hypothetical protein
LAVAISGILDVQIFNLGHRSFTLRVRSGGAVALTHITS